MEYFSDIERGPKPRTDETISPAAWGGIVALFESCVNNGAFGFKYPEICPDGHCTIGTNNKNFQLAIESEIPNIEWPLVTREKIKDGPPGKTAPCAPDTFLVLELIQFCYKTVAKPQEGLLHKQQFDKHKILQAEMQGYTLNPYEHYHLNYDEHSGKKEFRDSINKIFARNGIAFELCADGHIKRLVPEIIKEQISVDFYTGDPTLDRMLVDAKNKFLNPKPESRKEAVERLWDCCERLKSLENPKPDKKKESIEKLLNKISSVPEIHKLLDDELLTLTKIGNNFQIRHTEKSKIEISDSDMNDFLFYRMFAMIHLLIKKRKSTVDPSTSLGTTG